MKSILLALSLVSSLVFAQTGPTEKMLPGHYQGVDIESGTLNADLILNADHTLNFVLKSADFEIPEPGCTGAYLITGNDLTSDVTCPLAFLSTASVRMDITNVDDTTLTSTDGAEVPVFVDALGDEPIIFKMKLVTP